MVTGQMQISRELPHIFMSSFLLNWSWHLVEHACRIVSRTKQQVLNKKGGTISHGCVQFSIWLSCTQVDPFCSHKMCSKSLIYILGMYQNSHKALQLWSRDWLRLRVVSFKFQMWCTRTNCSNRMQHPEWCHIDWLVQSNISIPAANKLLKEWLALPYIPEHCEPQSRVISTFQLQIN